MHLALATGSYMRAFGLKTRSHTALFDAFPLSHRILGDNPRLGRPKPNPDIFVLALEAINNNLLPDEKPIQCEECLVFEDSDVGVMAGRRAGMRVVWVPHARLKDGYGDHHKFDDGVDLYPNLIEFDYGKYGVHKVEQA